jgi:hypothetical protein
MSSWRIDGPGDLRLALLAHDGDSFDSCVTDPPYELGFMGRSWDCSGVAYDPEAWRQVYRVLKPGAHLVAFGGTRTYHRMVCAIEDVGFEIRDTIHWTFGSGFPKNHNVTRELQESGYVCACELRDVQGAASEDAAESGEEILREGLRLDGQEEGARRAHVRGLPRAVDAGHARAAATQQDLLGAVRGPADLVCEEGKASHPGSDVPRVPCLLPTEIEHPNGSSEVLHSFVLGEGSVDRLRLSRADETNRAARAASMVEGGGGLGEREDAGRKESVVEWGRDVPPPSRLVRDGEVREVPAGPLVDGEVRRIHHGASAGDGANGPAPARSNRGRAPSRSQPAKQRPEQPRTVVGQSVPQAGGGWPTCSRCGKPVVGEIGTALKPSHELIVVARKPFKGTVAQNVARHGVGAINIAGCRVVTSDDLNGGAYAKAPSERHDGDESWRFKAGGAGEFEQPDGRWPPNVLLTHSADCRRVGDREVRAAAPPGPAAMPRARGAVFDESAFTGGSNGSRVSYGADGTETVPAYDCAPDCPVALLDRQSGELQSNGGRVTADMASMGFNGGNGSARELIKDSGGASRFFPTFEWTEEDYALFFYCAKATTAERNAGLGRDKNDHPTVKPIALMRWLCRLVTPRGGLVLDPFAGSGTTIIAALREQMRAHGLELKQRHLDIARARIVGDAPLLNVGSVA